MNLYFSACESYLLLGSTEDTEEFTQRLHEKVKDELNLASRRLADFKALRKQYEDGGRRELAVFMQENAKAGEYPTWLYPFRLC
jgi:hypothetical protein